MSGSWSAEGGPGIVRTTLWFWNVPRPREVKKSGILDYGGNRERDGGVGEF